MLHKISIEEYYKKPLLIPLVDVRSPGEFQQGHIVGAVNIPLFSDEERAAVGTVYKKKTKEKAVELGYEYVTPKLHWFLDESIKVAKEGAIAVYCWRGGMRSRSFAEHLHRNGFEEIYVIEGGYKAFRNYVLGFFEQELKLDILGGYTGSGKTFILDELKLMGEQVVDLEGLAHHKGSAFGSLGETAQPSSQHFENELFEYWRYLDIQRPVWLEDESSRIGYVQIPKALFAQMRSSQLYFIDIPKEERAKLLVTEYACFDPNHLANSINGIAKRLGGQNVKAALNSLEAKDYFQVAMITLQYYDKAYLKGVGKRDPEMVQLIPLHTVNHVENAKQLLEIKK
ncbi:MAG: tRNA 2-selenouridine(34) synthase MnmH [Bacteroidales bacterium]|nr:tRNA 2-selenouridine(34) synthase MnmH [Bacteroidales bacterium]